MKSIADYVELEPLYYQQILDNFEKLFLKAIDLKAVHSLKAVVLFATGSSSNAAYAARPFMSKILHLPVFIEEPSMAANYLYNEDKSTLYIAISQGGHSYSIVNLIKQFQQQNQTIYALTSDDNSPVYQSSEHVLTMGMPIEEMPYVSAGYSVTILDLILISLTLASQLQILSMEQLQLYKDKIQQIITQLPTVIKNSKEWVAKQQELFVNAKRIIFIGYGSTYGMAREGETKITETVHITALGKELEEYMHGPYIGLHEDDYIIFLEPQGKLEARAIALKKFLQEHVQHIFTIYAGTTNSKNNSDLCLDINCDELLTSLFMTIPIHLLSYHVSKLTGHNLEISTYPEFDEITKSKI
ncbi:glucosamine--fructose-6-phosphate aminotransferase [Bombilactobacillus bombi]|uniref:Glucosamine--fructose-6-phosphate aminotransferase n=1 Tax=Bombilactobacillus bombi TaxID=1303590 RepID=A0A417ZK31_9LACO|nr:SIS domain-containing protein [Bombilactobacillus bombi]RHW52374.1 glucosamine--fructose-6-phosphate aminotransferase [Bombilactobacillus bombi]